MPESRVVLFLFHNLGLLSEVLRVGVVKEVAVGGLPQPLVASLQLVGNVAVVIFFRILRHKFFGVG